MSDWPIGLSTGCFYHRSIFDCLEPIRQGGFCMIEVCSSKDHLNYHDHSTVRKASGYLKELGMEAYSFHAPFINVDISSLDEEQKNNSLKELLVAAEAAALLEVRHFVIHPGPDKVLSFSVEERMQRMKNAADILNIVAKRCQELGVGLVLENMLPHLPFGNSSDMLWIMGAMECLNICTCLDTGHAVLSGDIYNVLYKLSGHLSVMHANDNKGTSDDHLPPGKGIIDWPKVLFELSETNFHGGIILELSGNKDKKVEVTLDEARKARSFIRNIAKGLYLSSPPSVEVATRINKDGQKEH